MVVMLLVMLELMIRPETERKVKLLKSRGRSISKS